MAVVTRPCGDFHCVRGKSCIGRTSKSSWNLKAVCDFIKTQLCTIAISLTLFNSVRLPKEAFRHGAVPYLVVYSSWLLVAGLPTTLLQLAMGQLSQQDSVGVWRAVPILRGVGHLKVMTSYVCCVYYMMYVALSSAYLVWIGKGSFPLKDCTKLHITPHGYENKMNATECFNSTFLAPFTEYPQYLGIMAILIFLLWFFVPILLYRLYKTLKSTLAIIAIIIIVIAVLLSLFLGKTTVLDSMFESCVQWTSLYQPYIWHSSLVQALMSTQVVSGYLTSSGGSVYRHSDVRWTSALVIMTSIFSGWLWVLLWESIGGNGRKDTSFISILVLIYQSSVSERRNKEWPLLAFGVVFFSGIISVLILLYPVYDRLQRLTGDNWRIFACAASAVGTALTVAVLARGLEVATMLDELIVPMLAVFTSAVEVVGFVFIYGWSYLTVDIEFLTGVKLPYFWIATWWLTPVLFIGVSGWWLRALLRVSWGNGLTLWPLLAVFGVILVIMVMLAAVAVAKEEQFNLVTKISSAFRPSRLWGPEEPMARYVWMSQRYINETLSTENDTSSEQNNYSTIMYNKEMDKKYQDELFRNDLYQRTYNIYNKNDIMNQENSTYGGIRSIYGTHSIPRGKKKSTDEKYRAPNICIAKGNLGGPIECSCNRHFTLNVPDLRNNEVTTSL
ncbi:sodium- and chloride-dependent neutral and basic amino acid transporter B(0+) isoform X1 [Helicoverpa armigera]|uniref:sodium- and chloride-dependent neutral and basic amino acid transporter B(0+) isoform X1 n=1 Tax=Helicoverpa armigera TaxID=29058 RepID=UPI0030827570